MRTTLKRGVARGAAANANGNGRVNGRAVLPPGVLAPITIYRQPPRPRRRRLAVAGRVLLWLVGCVAVVAAGLGGGAYLFFETSVAAVSAGGQAVELEIAEKKLAVAPAGHPAIALVLGYDRRAGKEAKANGARSDTIMLVRADPRTDTVSMLSFPRDLYVDIHCPERAPFKARINAAYEECGAVGTLETVKKLTGLEINYLITVNFRGFKQMVAKLGGVWINVDRRYFNDNSQGGEGYATIDLQPGYQKLQGADALDFVRYRHADSDLIRMTRQQLFVKSFKEAITSGFSPLRLPEIIGVIRENVRVGVAGGKPVSGRTVLSYGLFAYHLPDGHFFQSRVEDLTQDDNFNLFVEPAKVEAAVNDFTSPDVEAPRKATDVVLGRKPTDSAPPPSETPVLVLNGNGVQGAAANAAYLLAQRGYDTIPPTGGVAADAPRNDYETTKVYFDPQQPQARPAARKLAELFPLPELAQVPPPIRPLANGAMVVVVLGRTFTGELLSAPVDRTPKREPPAVVKNPDVTRAALREVAPKAGFPLMLPTVLERTSRLAYEVPVRAYKIAGRPAVRLTYLTGLNEPWGIQMTTWQDAPILQGANETIAAGGRTFELHYVGTKLHMVVLRTSAGTYWVVNTLMNALSNDTMLAIAKGLRPLNAQ